MPKNEKEKERKKLWPSRKNLEGPNNPVIPTKNFLQSLNPDGFYRLILMPNIHFNKCLTEVPDSLIRDQWKMVVSEKWYGQNRHVTGLRKMWSTCRVKIKRFLTFRYRIPVLYNNISRISHQKTPT